MAFNTSSGDYCRSPSDVTRPMCRGACTGYDGLRLRAMMGGVQMDELYNSACHCCTGDGIWKTQPVICDQAGSSSVELFHYTNCACTPCE